MEIKETKQVKERRESILYKRGDITEWIKKKRNREKSKEEEFMAFRKSKMLLKSPKKGKEKEDRGIEGINLGENLERN